MAVVGGFVHLLYTVYETVRDYKTHRHIMASTEDRIMQALLWPFQRPFPLMGQVDLNIAENANAQPETERVH